MNMTSKIAPWLPNRDDLENKYVSYNSDFLILLTRLEARLKSCIKISSVPTFKGRVKNFPSYYRKLLRILPTGLNNRVDIPVLSDIIGIRVICPFLEDLHEVESCLQEFFSVYEIERKGADRTFREFGYESTHILLAIPEELKEGLSLPQDLIFEIQIRSILQDAWAEVEHELVYKSEFSPFDLPLKRKLASINASLSLADIIFQEIRDYQNKLNRELDKRRGKFYSQADIITGNSTESLAHIEMIDPIEDEVFQESSLLYVQGNIDDMILDAIYAHNEGNLEKAIFIYSKIIESEPNKNALSIMYKHRGMAFFASSHYNEALADFHLSAQADPKNFRAYYYMGIVLSVMGKLDESIENFSKSIEMNAYQPFVYFRRAQSFFQQALYTDSLIDLDKAVALGFNKPEEKVLRLKIAKMIDM